LYRYTEVQPAFAVKAIEHVNSYYNAFVSELLNKIDAQQAPLDSLQGQVDAAASAAAPAAAPAADAGGALADARAALRAHLEGVHPALVEYLDALRALGVDTVEDLGGLDEDSIESLNLKKMHRAKFMTACGKE
jgi:hypothetical protein